MFSRIDRGVIACGMALCLVSSGPSGQGYAAPAAPLRVLILSGGGDQGGRDTTPVLKRILADTGRFDVRICESPAGLSPRTLADFDLVVDDRAGSSPAGETEKAIAGFVESGKGLVITQAALGSSAGPITADGARPPDRSELATDLPDYLPVGPAGASPTSVQFFEVKLARPEHPIVQGMRPAFRFADATYRGLTTRPGAEVIATAVGETRGDGGKDEAVLIASGHGKGRVFCIALGHDAAAMHQREFLAAFARGSEWAATGAVTLPADLGPPRPEAGAVRGLVITGGHDHESAFYSLFDGYKDLDRLPVDASMNAFRKDLRSKYDVLIMYDFTRDMDEVCKDNLRRFVEGGKGIVVLHHALLNYQKWPWWYEEVVGGRYRLEPEGNLPTSSVKNDQEIFVTPAAEHPVTAGIGAFHITDEAYKRMWISDRVRPLLTTDNPTSDTSLAWIGPCVSSRVVAIQLGHGHSAFGHPSYRALVHNAVLWAAGKAR
jgi:type 1 glutamine amidotransferase